jgi:hypothetical protein
VCTDTFFVFLDQWPKVKNFAFHFKHILDFCEAHCVLVLGYVQSILGTTRCISTKEAQALASALRANYSKMFGSMIREYII